MVHQVWQHAETNEIWAVRLDQDVLTGVFGPIACTPSADVLPELPYEEPSDDLDWVNRSAEDFLVTWGAPGAPQAPHASGRT